MRFKKKFVRKLDYLSRIMQVSSLTWLVIRITSLLIGHTIFLICPFIAYEIVKVINDPEHIDRLFR